VTRLRLYQVLDGWWAWEAQPGLLGRFPQEHLYVRQLEKFTRCGDTYVAVGLAVEVATSGVDRDQVVRPTSERAFQNAIVGLVLDGGGGEKGEAHAEVLLHVREQERAIIQHALILA